MVIQGLLRRLFHEIKKKETVVVQKAAQNFSGDSCYFYGYGNSSYHRASDSVPA